MKQHIVLTWLVAAMSVLALGVMLSTLDVFAAPAAQGDVQVCANGLANGGFEQDSAWTLPVTPYRAAYSNERAHNGERSLRAGILSAAENRYSYSSANQALVFPTTVPTDVQTATLTLWWWPVSGEGELMQAAAEDVDLGTLQAIVDGVAPAAPLAGDRQYVILTDENNAVVARLLWTRSNAQTWQQSSFNLTPYLGRNLRVHVGVVNDGADGVTAMFADDISAQFCKSGLDCYFFPQIQVEPGATETPAPTLEPTVTPPATVEPTPEPDDTVWTDPGQSIEVFSPVADGLYHSPIEVRGFSQTFEGAVSLRLTDAGGQVLAERTAQGGSADGFDFLDSYLRFTISEQITATLEVFEVSAKDGSEINKVTIPLELLPGQRVVDLDRPQTGDAVCSPIFVSGYSNTFEATLLVTLSERDGTQVAAEPAMGGNLGFYADFSTVVGHTVDAPQPMLVGATEESAADGRPIDFTRVPVSLYPVGPNCPLP
jgi:hypothetical protein